MPNQLEIKCLPVGELGTNCYLVFDRLTREGIIVDPGDAADYIADVIRDLQVQPLQVLATHGHFDHILAAFELQQAYKIPFLISAKDVFLVDRMQDSAKFFLKISIPQMPPKIDAFVKEGDRVNFGRLSLKVFETPGHTPGSVCFYHEDSKTMFTGDTLFKSAVGRTDFSYGSSKNLQDSLQRLKHYPGKTQVYPGHGEATSLGEEL
ncbi:MAG: Beta-lactamase domain protein [Candidatus Gottesmanbacteria bacterium GW2011_GWB1_43_11]|uniref:Beta-lactamase domain protein n=1 Tax=Candidatus Gottesmanbacteria bacterium GW2011_GWB1_43_11 TaxID=1618446 RepID=A0A0G1CP45_9BACT|nr:MAG: Beta-lactamase domain protein [Candidatus Gottesmanbacteria bacterium GW2011_GWA2_42_16]KKS56328.1 MAG: Beta-lactamase domain protein [Candidatus Gottesmanbacteria bacterium GW2011_GWA1_42_26]KKS82336.1 MAG: Beta-lactamase domain protein [Candidatus Gottesmanbacteria bacterium GW2011_GWC1_43_10]KKS87530.1 MAG: Beta-lactamase domain protein [Candidatus Gottesmanbacteria bacterium GW2011_GWB1_43_11]HCM37698.1 hypothetical protein [Patescibacteria group bacterium]